MIAKYENHNKFYTAAIPFILLVMDCAEGISPDTLLVTIEEDKSSLLRNLFRNIWL